MSGVTPRPWSKLLARAAVLAAALLVTAIDPACAQSNFVRGDLDEDSALLLSDVTTGLGYLFQGVPLDCLDAADVNDDGTIDLSDVVYVLVNLFSGGPIPPSPYPTCQIDPTPDSLSCIWSAICPPRGATFSPDPDVPIANEDSTEVEAVDVSGDGNIDLVIASNEGFVEIHLGAGGGDFESPTTYVTGLGSQAVEIADFNEDGLLDLVTVNYHHDSISVLLGLGDGVFAPATSIFVGDDGPGDCFVHDFDGDGHVDIATANGYPGTVGILLGFGDGTFDAPTLYPTIDRSPQPLVHGDIDGDGAIDIITADISSFSLLRGDGLGGLSPAELIPAPPGWITSTALADVDGDFDPDLLVCTRNPDNFVVMENDGSGQFTQAEVYGFSTDPRAITMLDVNGDGALEALLAFGAASDSLRVLFGNGDGTFLLGPQYTGYENASSIKPADLDDDGDLDLVFMSSSLQLVYQLLAD